MTIKKLTVAAAIAVGIATCSLNSAMAACPCMQPAPQAPCEQLPVVTGPACPCDPAPKCNKCQKAIDECDCQKADPCNDPCKDDDPCPPKKSDCGCQNDEISCDKPAEPACTVCPMTGKPDRADMKQVYGYPNAIYGTNNYVGKPASSILSSETGFLNAPSALSSNVSGTTVASDSQITGAAAQIPCLNEAPTRHNGIPIMRNELTMDGNNCAIDMQTANSIDAIKRNFVPYTITEPAPTGAAAGLSSGGCQFPDVPENHWAYEAVETLAKSGLAVGYPDGQFKGDRSLTRYEFAEIVHRALQAGVGVDARLVEEFKPELEFFRIDTITTDADGNPVIQRVRVNK